MRVLAPAILLVLFAVVSGCSSEPRMIVAETGPAYSELRGVSDVRVLAVKMPKDIKGEGGGAFDPDEKKDLPLESARYIADGINGITMNRISAVSDTERPRHGIYVEVVVRSMDVGERSSRPFMHTVGGHEGWSRVLADVYIYDADTGKLCARLDVDQSSGAGDQLEADMTEIGRQIGLWLEYNK
ncbi:MAG: hypothetical protein IT462_05665 [Planctomycetes bacterium]|nr:hypothetical protein [Planctomycetota bacterium]